MGETQFFVITIISGDKSIKSWYGAKLKDDLDLMDVYTYFVSGENTFSNISFQYVRLL